MDLPSGNDASGATTEIITRDAAARAAAPPLTLRLGGQEERAAGGISFSVVWHSLMQRLFLGVALGIVLASVACIVLWKLTEPVYRGVATLQILEKPNHIVFEGAGINSQRFAQTQIELIKHPYLIGRAVEEAKLVEQVPELVKLEGKADPVQWIEKRLKVTRKGTSELYNVSFDAEYPVSAERVVNAIVRTYRRISDGESDQMRDHVLKLLEKEKDRSRQDIALKQSQLKELFRKAGPEVSPLKFNLNLNGGAEGTDTMSVGQTLMTSLQTQYVEAQLGMLMTKIKLDAANKMVEQKNGEVPVSDWEIEIQLSQHPRVMKLQDELLGQQSIINTVTEGKDRHMQAKEAHKKALAHLEAIRAELAPQARLDVAAAKKRQQDAALQELAVSLKTQVEQIELLRRWIEEERTVAKETGETTLDLTYQQMELAQAQDLSRRLADRKLALTVEAHALGQVKIIQEAAVPDFPEGPSLVKKLLMLGSVAFLAPLGLLVGWDLSYRRVYERDQLLREVDVKLVSEIAALPTRSLTGRGGSDKAFRQQALLFEESVNALRTTLSVDPNLEKHRVYVLASAVSGEGKTNLSSQLAMSWAQSSPGKVIIIDADLRAPNVHDLFEVEPRPGLAEVLRGECTLEEAIVMDWGGRLFILPAGEAKARTPTQLFSSAKFHEALATLRSHYYKVIIDVPPVLCASETLQIAKAADGVLLCTLRDYSRSGQVKEAYDRLNNAGVNVVGAVLNGTPSRQYSYYYRGYAPT